MVYLECRPPNFEISRLSQTGKSDLHDIADHLLFQRMQMQPHIDSVVYCSQTYLRAHDELRRSVKVGSDKLLLIISYGILIVTYIYVYKAIE